MAVVYSPTITPGARLVVDDVNCQAVCNPDGTAISGSGGGSSNTVITGPLGAQTPAASVATVISGATANGNTTSTTTNLTTGGPTTITAGAISIEFLLSSDFVGTINGATVNNTGTIVLGVYRLDAPPWKPLAALTYTITAGTCILTIQT
jgi:hypothetical protein